MELRLAIPADLTAVRAFFARYLSRENDGVTNEEFFCPVGIKWAIERRQMLLALDGQRIIGAVRFYPKKSGEVSLYQFAVAPESRGRSLARAMFDAVRAGRPMRSLCPPHSALNDYYRRTGWTLDVSDSKLNQWLLS